jgi:hypothetical protein
MQKFSGVRSTGEAVADLTPTVLRSPVPVLWSAENEKEQSSWVSGGGLFTRAMSRK